MRFFLPAEIQRSGYRSVDIIDDKLAKNPKRWLWLIFISLFLLDLSNGTVIAD
jgi:hypothetical protein